MLELQLIFTEAHRQLRPRTTVPEIKIEFFPFAGLNHTVRRHENRLMVRLSDMFADAPREVFRSLALILFARLYGQAIDNSYHRIYRAFTLTEHMQERARLARLKRSRRIRARGARGVQIDLELLFDQVNQEYFGGALVQPRLSWSARKSRHILGRYDATHNIIFISRALDVAVLPTYVVAYVLFHEMLHLKHRIRVHDSRMMVHTPEFKAEERTFRQYEKVKFWLDRI